MKAAHTPGPWEQWVGHATILAGPAAKNEIGQLSGFRRPICEIVDAEGEEPFDGLEEEEEANARLIAAAPEMLAALHEARDVLEDSYGACIQAVDAAIAKAEGGAR